jgi:enolase
LLDVYADFCRKYNIVSIEDPFDQDDWEGWSMITKKMGEKV